MQFLVWGFFADNFFGDNFMVWTAVLNLESLSPSAYPISRYQSLPQKNWIFLIAAVSLSTAII